MFLIYLIFLFFNNDKHARTSEKRVMEGIFPPFSFFLLFRSA